MIEIKLDSIANIRDFGGTITKDGRTIRRNKLIRSAHLGKATKEDIEFLEQEHGLRSVVDLRTKREVHEVPDQYYDLNYLYRPIIEAFEDGITHEKQEVHKMPDLEETYRMIVKDEKYSRNLKTTVETIMDQVSQGAVLWHCSEGKDRCGMVSVMMHLLLGVDKQTIFEDYLFTNKVNIPKAEKIYQEYFDITGDEETARSIYKAFIADEKYLRAAFEEMGDHYIEDVLKIDPEKIERFRNELLN